MLWHILIQQFPDLDTADLFSLKSFPTSFTIFFFLGDGPFQPALSNIDFTGGTKHHTQRYDGHIPKAIIIISSTQSVLNQNDYFLFFWSVSLIKFLKHIAHTYLFYWVYNIPRMICPLREINQLVRNPVQNTSFPHHLSKVRGHTLRMDSSLSSSHSISIPSA